MENLIIAIVFLVMTMIFSFFAGTCLIDKAKISMSIFIVLAIIFASIALIFSIVAGDELNIKHCPNCDEIYFSDKNYCPKDGAKLIIESKGE